QSRFEELVASTLEAKAAAPCKALKRRVCQRARKKLAHMLPQEEFEKVVATWSLVRFTLCSVSVCL
ncbi:unnamed protein product, partial [Durusdinium trenchii]